ncbi:hypothetical protein V6N11_059902 [Hibiscus sabdariffa]|uniref:Uncharacterized protein n=1 Tax=Hibiscus sabdariffa TaxID=183260 RepID=A0ABR2NYE4_9ROSI
MSLQKLLSLVVHDGDASDTSPLVTGVALTALVFGTSRRTSIADGAGSGTDEKSLASLTAAFSACTG